MDRRRYDFHLRPPGSVHGLPAERRSEGSDGSQRGVTETHVGRWGHLPPQGRQVSVKGRGEGGHGDVVGILDRGVRGR